jgi:hypothetical protein
VISDVINTKNEIEIFVFKSKYNYKLYFNNPEYTKMYGGNYKGFNASQAANKAYNRLVKIMNTSEKDMTTKQLQIYNLFKKNFKKKDNNLHFSLINNSKTYNFKCSQVAIKNPVKYVIYPSQTPVNEKLNKDQIKNVTVKEIEKINPLFKLREIAYRNKLILLR